VGEEERLRRNNVISSASMGVNIDPWGAALVGTSMGVEENVGYPEVKHRA